MLDPTEILTQGAVAGAIPHAWQYFQARQARRDLIEDRAYDTARGVASKGKKDTDETGVRWIRRVMTGLFGLNFFAILWLLLLAPQYSHGLMQKFNKVLFFGGEHAIIYTYLHFSLVAVSTLFWYYLGGLAKYKK